GYKEESRKTSCLLGAHSHCLLFSSSLCVSVSLWHSCCPKVVRFDLEVELQSELNNARLISRGEAGKLARRFIRTAFDADIRYPQLIQEERPVGHIIHSFEVGLVEEIECVEDQLELERVVGVEAEPPSQPQISGKEPRPDASVASHRKR